MGEECPDRYNNLTSTLGLDILKLEVAKIFNLKNKNHF
jgi:hypothetical protein